MPEVTPFLVGAVLSSPGRLAADRAMQAMLTMGSSTSSSSATPTTARVDGL
jgi:hypothetical protein